MFSCHQSFASTVASTEDVSFYADLLKREELHLDDEKLKEFFPLEGTIDRILEAPMARVILGPWVASDFRAAEVI